MARLFSLLFFIICNGSVKSATNTFFDDLHIYQTDKEVLQKLKKKYYATDTNYFLRERRENEKVIRFAPVQVYGLNGVLAVHSVRGKVARYDWYMDSVAMWIDEFEMHDIGIMRHGYNRDFELLRTKFSEKLGKPEAINCNGEEIIYWKKDGITIRYLAANKSINITKGSVAPLDRANYDYQCRSVMLDTMNIRERLYQKLSDLKKINASTILENKEMLYGSTLEWAFDSMYRRVSIKDTIFGIPALTSFYLFDPNDKSVLYGWSLEVNSNVLESCVQLLEKTFGPSTECRKDTTMHQDIVNRCWEWENEYVYYEYFPGFSLMFVKASRIMRTKYPYP